MQDRTFEELIDERQLLRIRETAVIAEIREAIATRDGIEQGDDVRVEDVNQAAVACGPRIGDRVRIKNKQDTKNCDDRNENRERLATVTRETVEQVHITTDTGTRTWRAPNNLRLI